MVFGFLSSFVFQIPFHIFVFLDFKLRFLFNVNVLLSKRTSKKTMGQEGDCNKMFFLITCDLQNVKSYR